MTTIKQEITLYLILQNNQKDEVEDLKHLRGQDQNNNIILIKENSKMQATLTDIFNRTITCPTGNEKIVLNKIKELAREYQSKN